jgi:hypothetical protein
MEPEPQALAAPAEFGRQVLDPDHATIADEIAIGSAQWPDLTDEQLRQIMSPAFSAGYEIPQPFVDEARGMNLHLFAATSQAVRAYLEEQALPGRLAILGKPLLVIFGEDDRRWRPSSAADYRAVPEWQSRCCPASGTHPTSKIRRGPPSPSWPSPRNTPRRPLNPERSRYPPSLTKGRCRVSSRHGPSLVTAWNSPGSYGGYH